MMHKVYGDINSGNCYKIKLLMNLLDIEHEWIHIDILKGESRTPNFLKLNPNGRIPVLVSANGYTLFESNAILNYLAEATEFLPAEALERAKILQWQFYEQYSHEPYIATSRYIIRYLNTPEDRKKDLQARRQGGLAALDIMENHLQGHDYFVGDRYTIADISLYAYTRVADEGGFNLENYPAIQAWFQRIEGHPGHVSMSRLSI